MRTRAALAALLLALSAGTAAAQAKAPPILSSRLGIAKPTGIIAPRHVQVEAGYARAHTGVRTRQTFGETALRIGVGMDTEVRIGVPSYQRTATSTAHVNGLSDAALGVKHRFRMARGLLPALAASVGATLPTGAEGVGAGAAQPEASLAAEWTLAPRLRAAAFTAHRSAILDDDRFGLTTGAVALRFDATPRATLQLDLADVHSTRAGGTETARARGTAAFRLTPSLQLDAYAERASTSGAAETFVGVGVARRW
jgi:hypothetical protein